MCSAPTPKSHILGVLCLSCFPVFEIKSSLPSPPPFPIAPQECALHQRPSRISWAFSAFPVFLFSRLNPLSLLRPLFRSLHKNVLCTNAQVAYPGRSLPFLFS